MLTQEQEPAHEYEWSLTPEREEKYTREIAFAKEHFGRMKDLWGEIGKLPRNGKILLINMVYAGVAGHERFAAVPEELKTYYFDVQTGGLVTNSAASFVPATFAYSLGLDKDDSRLEVVDPKPGKPLDVDLSKYFAVLLSGSEAMMTWVNEQPERSEVGMIHTVVEALQKLKARPVPVLGICFGSQVFTSSMGGRVGWVDNTDKEHPKSEYGPVLIHKTEAGKKDELLAGLPDSFAIEANHAQHVIDLPEGAVVLAENSLSAVQAARFAPGVYTVQNHPEASSISTDVANCILATELPKYGIDVEERSSAVLTQDVHYSKQIFYNFIKIAAAI